MTQSNIAGSEQHPWWGKIFGENGWQAASEVLEPLAAPGSGAALWPKVNASIADMDAAVVAATTAQPAWRDLPVRQRSDILARVAVILQRDADHIAALAARETGAVLGKAQFEVGETIEAFKIAAGLCYRAQGTVLPTNGRQLSVAQRIPVGVVGVISPFNFPMILGARNLAPALALGNAVILKPDMRTPYAGGYAVAQALAEAGLPAGLLHVLPSDQKAEHLVTHPEIPVICFTGSPNVGRRIGALAGEALKKVSLELGGANSLIILEDCDLEVAASNAAWGAWLHQGQICMASNRLLVQSSIVEPFSKLLLEKARNLPVGDVERQDVALGPIIDSRQADRFLTMLAESEQQGVKVLTGGDRDGTFIRPVVTVGAKPGMPIFDEESFGPLANIIPFDSDDDAIALANHNVGSLSCGIISNDVGRAMRIGAQLRTGMLHINDQTVNDESVNPFGGPGSAGNGHSVGGDLNLDLFTRWQWMTVKDRATPYPF